MSEPVSADVAPLIAVDARLAGCNDEPLRTALTVLWGIFMELSPQPTVNVWTSRDFPIDGLSPTGLRVFGETDPPSANATVLFVPRRAHENVHALLRRDADIAPSGTPPNGIRNGSAPILVVCTDATRILRDNASSSHPIPNFHAVHPDMIAHVENDADMPWVVSVLLPDFTTS